MNETHITKVAPRRHASRVATGLGMLAAQVAMNTTIAAATGGLVVFILRLIMLRTIGSRHENCLVVWNMNFIFPYFRNNNPNWLIFFRGVETTNQMTMTWKNIVRRLPSGKLTTARPYGLPARLEWSSNIILWHAQKPAQGQCFGIFQTTNPKPQNPKTLKP